MIYTSNAQNVRHTVSYTKKLYDLLLSLNRTVSDLSDVTIFVKVLTVA